MKKRRIGQILSAYSFNEITLVQAKAEILALLPEAPDWKSDPEAKVYAEGFRDCLKAVKEAFK